MTARAEVTLKLGDHELRVTHPEKVVFPARGWTKMDVAMHYAACADGALGAVRGRPCTLKRWPQGAAGDPFFQKRAPQTPGQGAPAGLPREYATIHFPSGRQADLFVPRLPIDLLWMVQLDCLDLNPWPVRAEDLDRPDELRIDLDPSPDASFAWVQEVAMLCGEVLTEHGLVGYAKTSGSRGIHIFARIAPEWGFTELRRAALALAREVERRRPDRATTAWWKEQRHGVFIDYNQNARDRTMASAYSARQTGLVSAPLRWDEVPDAELEDFPMVGFAARYAKVGDLMAGMDQTVGRLDGLLDLALRDAEGGLGDAPWPPHFPKQDDEPPRVQPSRRRKPPEGPKA